MIARLIKAGRDSIGHQRQVFYAAMGGFDTHGRQMLPGVHEERLKDVSDAMLAFNLALQEINGDHQVGTFTISEFARTPNSNGSGTDHAWGGVQWVMGKPRSQGGPLEAGRVFGSYPLLEIEGEETYGRRGNVIPTLSTQAYGASLSSWLGVEKSQIGTIFPGLDRFDVQDIGLLA